MAQQRELDKLGNQLDWNLLRTFMVIVQEGSITAAANRLFLTQPAVSLALAGRLVIYRKGKPADPTDFRGVYRLGLPRHD